MLCPSCKTPLSMSDRSGIEIDFCPSCRGVWLDRGELDKILERSAAPAARIPTPHVVDDRHDRTYGHGYRPRKKKSFLSDIFEFD